MKMFKITPFLLALLIIMQNFCLAHPSISDEQAVLGWVTIFDTPEKVESIYGKPKSIEESYNGFCGTKVYIYHYGDSFDVYFNKNTDQVCLVSTEKNNGIKLPNGITAGSSIYEVERKFGPRFDNTMAHYKPFPLSHRANVTLSFRFDENGKVKEIMLCHWDINK